MTSEGLPGEEDIDNDILIEEIENSVALYKKELKDYSDINAKKRLCEEACEKFVSCHIGRIDWRTKNKNG
jgi:hypothetical protein